MINCNSPIYLASKSPRRKKLLKQINLNFSCFTVNLNEEIVDGEHPVKTVKRLARLKMELAQNRINRGIIITADTIVVLDGKILGKPKNKKDAERILMQLSGKTHLVYSGFVVYNKSNGKKVTGYSKTAVSFRNLSSYEIREYIRSGSPMDKAGAYGIQDDFGAVFVEKISGCYYNVVGLPLSKVYKALREVC